MYRSPIKRLTNQEYDVLMKIAYKTKTDCWFSIRSATRKGEIIDIVYDLENHKQMSLKKGIDELTEALDCPENFYNCQLTFEENEVWQSIHKRMFGRPFVV